MGRPNIYDVSWFWSTVLLMVLFCDVEVNGQLLPQSLGRPATNKKTFENGVVSCGSTFCDPTRCKKKLVDGKEIYYCEDDENRK